MMRCAVALSTAAACLRSLVPAMQRYQRRFQGERCEDSTSCNFAKFPIENDFGFLRVCDTISALDLFLTKSALERADNFDTETYGSH